jgi:predicted outer membrane repeat protein
MKKILFIILCIGINVLSIAQIIHVPADQSTIQAGINAASNGDTVLVADGNYLENIDFMGKAITVASHFLMNGDTNHINNTVIDGSQPDNPDFGSVVTFITGEDTTSVLCGFTVTGGTGMYLTVYDARAGGGIACYYATAKIIHNKVINNQVESSVYAWGAGIASINEIGDSWTVIESNIIRNNSSLAGSMVASGGGIEVWGNVRICQNLIENNDCYCESGQCLGGGVLVDSPGDTASWFYCSDNIIRDNSLESVAGLAWGGGMYVKNSHCTIRNNIISSNTSTGGSATGGGLTTYEIASLELANNLISLNQISLNAEENWYGAGFHCATPTGPVVIMNNEFSYNSGTPEGWGRGGGLCILYAWENEVTLDANLFLENHCFRGGGFYEQNCHNILFTNNIFSQNTATWNGQGRGAGIALYNPSSSSVPQSLLLNGNRSLIINNTFCSNTADYQGGAIHYNGALSPPAIINCIFWENEAPTGRDINNVTSQTVVVSFSNIYTNTINGSWTGIGNIDVDPGFIEGDTLYHLSATSPCLNTGIDSIEIEGIVYFAPLTDLDGETRPDPAYFQWDMGADEFFLIPEAPVALPAPENGCDYFIAQWQKCFWAEGYYLDVAFDTNFDSMLPGFNNLDVGGDSIYAVENLDPGLFYYYRTRAYNDAGISSNSNTIEVDLCVGVEELQATGCRLQVFPNPGSGRLNINYQLAVGSWQLAVGENVRITVHEITGKQIVTLVDEKQVPGDYVFPFDSSWLPGGIYLIRLQAEDWQETIKIIHLP